MGCLTHAAVAAQEEICGERVEKKKVEEGRQNIQPPTLILLNKTKVLGKRVHILSMGYVYN